METYKSFAFKLSPVEDGVNRKVARLMSVLTVMGVLLLFICPVISLAILVISYYFRPQDCWEWIDISHRQPDIGQYAAFVVDCPRSPEHGKMCGGKYLGDELGTHDFAAPGFTVAASHWMPLPDKPIAEPRYSLKLTNEQYEKFKSTGNMAELPEKVAADLRLLSSGDFKGLCIGRHGSKITVLLRRSCGRWILSFHSAAEPNDFICASVGSLFSCLTELPYGYRSARKYLNDNKPVA